MQTRDAHQERTAPGKKFNKIHQEVFLTGFFDGQIITVQHTDIQLSFYW
jgi:hypothetical protein